MLVQMIHPTNILEVGTFSGYSAICLAEGLEDNGKVWTFEINDEMEDFTRPWIENSPVAHSLMATNARILRLTKWLFLLLVLVVSLLPITPFGMAMFAKRLIFTTIKRRAFAISTTIYAKTHA